MARIGTVRGTARVGGHPAQLGMPLRPPTANELSKSRPSRINRKTRKPGFPRQHPSCPSGEPPQDVLFQGLPAFPHFITSGLPSYTIGSISGEPHADTRGCLEAVV